MYAEGLHEDLQTIEVGTPADHRHIVMIGTLNDVPLLRPPEGIEDGSPEERWNDLVTIAMNDQDGQREAR